MTFTLCTAVGTCDQDIEWEPMLCFDTWEEAADQLNALEAADSRALTERRTWDIHPPMTIRDAQGRDVTDG